MFFNMRCSVMNPLNMQHFIHLPHKHNYYENVKCDKVGSLVWLLPSGWMSSCLCDSKKSVWVNRYMSNHTHKHTHTHNAFCPFAIKPGLIATTNS